MGTPQRRVSQEPRGSCSLLVSHFLTPTSQSLSPLSLVVLLGPACAEGGGGGGGLCFNLLPSEPWVGWGSGDGEMMLGLPSHVCFGQEPCQEERWEAGRLWQEAQWVVHRMPWASKQGNGVSGRDGWLKRARAGGAGHFGRAE